MRQYIIPALITASASITGWNSLTIIEVLRRTDGLESRQDYAIESLADAISNMNEIEAIVAQNTREIARVPNVIASTLEVSQILSELTDYRSARIRLRRIVDGDAANPPQQVDFDDYAELIQDIESACDRLVSRNADHRECNR